MAHTLVSVTEPTIVGKSFIQLNNQGNLIHIGPHFPTFIGYHSATSLDKIFSSKHSYLNTLAQPDNIVTSDYITIFFSVNRKNNFANWNIFQTLWMKN